MASGISPADVLKTQIANLTGNSIIGLNADQGSEASDRVAANKQTHTSNGVIYNAAGDVIGNVKGASSPTSQPSSGGSYQAPADPYAAYGGADAYNNLINGFNTQKSNIYGGAADAAANTGSQLNGSILDLLDFLRSGQSAIDTKATKNELAKQQGTQNILGMVGRGIKSSGVMLANKNAGDSSAAQALADAYGTQGRAQLSNVGNQYELGNQDIKLEQADLGTQQAAGVRHLQDSKMQAVNSIVADARDKFAQLDANAANANLPTRIAIDQEKEAVRNQVLQQLQQYDQQLNSGVSSIHGLSPDEVRQKAAEMARAGTDLGQDAFQYTTDAPLQLQNTGPSASPLPLFSLNAKKQFA